ncbi:SpoIIE family protein phosphatase [Streptomyces sp. NPDC047706]|uniref:PP2C family protein-serine/threonine phosphatase n=1 Tax=Streptomyces sp. NPDC047706 TaxID=3365486 RepID=UPI0037158C3A
MEEQRTPELHGVLGAEQAADLPYQRSTLNTARAVSRGAALAGAALGAVGLTGWVSGLEVLRRLPGAGATMDANTTVALLALGASLFVSALAPARGRVPVGLVAAARAAAVLGSLIGGLTLVQYLTGTSLGIDELVVEDDAAPPAGMVRGRMAANTALALTIAGVAALCASLTRLPAWTSQVPGLVVLALGMLRLYGFTYAVPELERFGLYKGMALYSGLALMLLGASALLVRPDEGPASLLTNAGTTGALGRRLFATVLVAPPLLGWLVLAGEDAGLFGTRLSTALLVFGHVIVFGAVVFAVLTVGRRVEVAHARAEWQVRQNELLQAFMDHTPAVLFIKDLDGRFLAVNTTFEESLGLPAERVLGRRDQDVLPPDLARQARAADLDMLAGGEPLQREQRLALPQGPRDFLTSLFPLSTASGKPYAVGGVVTDITEQVAAQREVRQASRRFVALLESAPDALLITNGQGAVVMANAQVQRMFGRAPADLLGAAVVDLVPGPARQRHSALLRAYLGQEHPKPIVVDRGLYGLRGDGGEFPVEVSVSSLQAEEETLVFLTVRDITERRQVEAERAERYEEHRRIAYTLQHSLMGEPPRLRGLPTAHRYLASVQDPGVGGDWFDVVPLGRDRTGIVVGDVMGRGLEAAAVMGQLRAASHALARTGVSPSGLMTGLDAFVGDLADQLVTCVYMVIDQGTHEVTVSSAGHLPVVLLPPGEAARRLQAPVGVPLGVNDSCGSGVPFRQTTQPLPAGSALALYTDGLVERPGTDIEAQIDILTHTLDTALKDVPPEAESLERAVDQLIGALIPDTAVHDDDVTLLLVGLPESRG